MRALRRASECLIFLCYWQSYLPIIGEKMYIKTVNVGGGRLKHRNIRRSETRFKAPIRAVLTRPEPHKTVQNSSINGEKSVQKQWILAEVALNTEILCALRPLLKPSFLPFWQAWNRSEQIRTHHNTQILLIQRRTRLQVCEKRSISWEKVKFQCYRTEKILESRGNKRVSL